VCDRVAQLLGAKILEEIHNHHNYAWAETHQGVEYMVIRKGATPAFPGQRGFIGGSMAEDAVIIEGVDSDVSKTALYSTVHGAGRTMGRNEARRTFRQRIRPRGPSNGAYALPKDGPLDFGIESCTQAAQQPEDGCQRRI
jgi:tRNA-splicing ligase RtcB